MEHEIEAVYRRDFHRFLRVAEAICGDVETARDAVQDGFASALRSARSFRRESSLETWLWAAVVNAARSARRRRSGHDPFDELADRRTTAPAERSPLPKALAELPERQRIVLFLRYYADLDYAAIAATLGISTGTVGATLNHAHAALRRRLQEVQ
jgi:RNA polymerase sigma-70 factor (ECF subfamily)